MLGLLAAACAPDLDYRLYTPGSGDAEGVDAAVGEDGTGEEEDLAEPEDLTLVDLRGADLKGRDMTTVRDLAAPRDKAVAGDLAAASCPPPLLLIAVEDTGGKGGKIDRYSLGGYGTQRKCSSLTAGGFLPASITAAAWIPDEGVAFAGPEGVGLIDVETDSLRWSRTINEYSPRAFDVFPLSNPLDGKQVVAAAFGTNGSSMIRVVYGFLPDGTAYKFGTQPKWEMNSTSVLALGLGVMSMTASPYDAGRVFYVNESGSTTAAAAEADPFAAMKPADPFVLYPPNARVRTVHAFRGAGAVNRLAWAGESNSKGAVFYLNDTAGGSNRNASGPAVCATATCTYLHAVADPVETTGLIALCETAAGTRQVVRWRITSSTLCSTVASASLPARMSYLGLVLR